MLNLRVRHAVPASHPALTRPRRLPTIFVVYLTDMAHYPRVNTVYEEAFAPNRSARTCVAVSVLPVRERMKIETVACKGRP